MFMTPPAEIILLPCFKYMNVEKKPKLPRLTGEIHEEESGFTSYSD